MAGKLYVVSTPIGNLEDITLRALRILREVDLIAAEDTRVTRRLLAHYDIHTPLISYHQHSRGARSEEIVRALVDGVNVALVSDAGTPGISDPGHGLISRCIEDSVDVVPVPGPTAIMAALVVSGMDTTRFAFEGFVPRKDRERQMFFEAIRVAPHTTCVYEAPNRLLSTLGSIESAMPERRIAVVREATKKFEEVFRGVACQAIAHFSGKAVKGEVVIVLSGADMPEHDGPEVDSETVRARLSALLAAGESMRDAVRKCAEEFGVPRKEVYALALAVKADPGQSGGDP